MPPAKSRRRTGASRKRRSTAASKPERLADDVTRRQRQHGGGEEPGVEDAEGEQRAGEMAGQRFERAREVDRLRMSMDASGGLWLISDDRSSPRWR